MKRMMGISGEQSDHKIAGFFDDADEAQRTARYLESSLKGGHAHVMVLDSSDKNVDAKLEPERRGIWHTLIRAHVWLALAGAVAGVLVFAILGGIGVAFVAKNPAWSSGLLILFGAIGGLLLGGAFTIRPDHAPYIQKTRHALEQGQHVVVVHTLKRSAIEEAEELLGQRGAETIRTL